MQDKISASGMKLTPEVIDGAFSMLGMVATGRLSIPGISAHLIQSLKAGDARKLTNAIAREASPEKRAERSAQITRMVEASAPMRATGANKLTAALNKAGESVGGRSDLGDVARVRGNAIARAAATLGGQAKVKAGEVLENTSDVRATRTLRRLKCRCSCLRSGRHRQQRISQPSWESPTQAGVNSGALRGMTGVVGTAGKTVGSAEVAVDLASVILEAMDNVVRPAKPDRPEDI